MADVEHIKKTLDVMLAQIDGEERATAEKKRAANELCRLLQQAVAFPDVDVETSALTTRADEYYGRPMPDVIRAILEKRKKGNLGAATPGEILAAMVQGGFHFLTKKPAYAKRGVYGILAGNGSFHKLPDGRYGLASWYPAAKTKSKGGKQKRRPYRRKKMVKKEPESDTEVSKS
jgi:hypothetical protein